MEITQEQFNNIATKDDITRLDTDISRLDSKIDKLEEKVDARFDVAFDYFASKEDLNKFVTTEVFEKRMDDISGTLDYIVKKLDTMAIEQTSNVGAHDRMDEKTHSIDMRVTKLEARAI